MGTGIPQDWKESQSWGLCHSRASYYQGPHNIRVC